MTQVSAVGIGADESAARAVVVQRLARKLFDHHLRDESTAVVARIDQERILVDLRVEALDELANADEARGAQRVRPGEVPAGERLERRHGAVAHDP